MKALTMVLIIAMILAATVYATEAQINPKKPEFKTLEERTKVLTEKVANEQKMYGELFGDCHAYLRQAISDVNHANTPPPKWADPISTLDKIYSIRGLLNLEIYKMCRGLKGEK